MLGMAFFKSLAKEHLRTYFEPIGKGLQRAGLKTFNPTNPKHAWALRKEMTAYAKWVIGRKFLGRDREQVPGLPPKLAEHVQFALDQFQRAAVELSGAMRKHQLKLADRQCRIAELSQRVQDAVVMLVTALWGGRQQSEAAVAAADILCQDLRRKLTGQRPSDRYFRDAGQLADMILAGQYDDIASIPTGPIQMPYSNS
jgi:hypothetical protein